MQTLKILGIGMLLLAAALPAQAQSQRHNVTFIHGLNGDASSWAPAASELFNAFPIQTQFIQYSSNQKIADIAANKYPTVSDNTIVIAHSLGGLVSRQMVRDHGEDKIRALITVGSPHTGALAATLPLSQIPTGMLARWISDVLEGPLFLLGGSKFVAYKDWILDLLFHPVDAVIEHFLYAKFGQASARDLQPNSAFMQSINANSANTFPAAHYTLSSSESWPAHFRIVESSIKEGVEDGTIAYSVWRLNYIYLGQELGFYELYELWYDRFLQTGDPDDYDRAVRTLNLSFAFGRGYNSWCCDQPLSWETYVTGALAGSNNEFSDALLPLSSQAPSFVPAERRVPLSRATAQVNHLEQTKHPDMIALIDATLRQSDIAAHIPPPPPALNISISGPSSLNVDETGDWSATVSSGSHPYSYSWSYLIECPAAGPLPDDAPCDAWQSGGGGSTFSFSRPYDATVQIRLTVVDSANQSAQVNEVVVIGVGTTTPPLLVNINGPNELNANATGFWTTSVSGGLTPYTYLWEYRAWCRGDLAAPAHKAQAPLGDDPPIQCITIVPEWEDGGNGSTFSTQRPAGFNLEIRLTITDALNQTESMMLLVYPPGISP